jgi:transposase
MRIRRPRHPRPDVPPCVNPPAAGLDLGSEGIWACGPEDRDAEPVRPFGTFTPDLYALADWLTACRMEPVALAATGGAWLPRDALLEARGVRVSLGQAPQGKQGPGRQRAVQACPWLQHGQICGLRRASCRPDAARPAWRADRRQRAM